jgi:predicted RNase H-like nuclease (RuvC/YqgF family)
MKFKPYYTDVLLVCTLIILFLGIIKISRLENEQRSMKEEISHKDSIIQVLEDEVESFEDILQEREMEVRHWGMKYDSIKSL